MHTFHAANDVISIGIKSIDVHFIDLGALFLPIQMIFKANRNTRIPLRCADQSKKERTDERYTCTREWKKINGWIHSSKIKMAQCMQWEKRWTSQTTEVLSKRQIDGRTRTHTHDYFPFHLQCRSLVSHKLISRATHSTDENRDLNTLWVRISTNEWPQII